jgi:hypothetical protein
LTPAERRAHLDEGRRLFNGGEYWRAHEALETVWRSIIRTAEPDAAAEGLIWQGFIQAAAALLHLERGNQHGVTTVGGAALIKLDGPQHEHVEFEMPYFRAQLARALAGEGDPPTLEYWTADA